MKIIVRALIVIGVLGAAIAPLVAKEPIAPASEAALTMPGASTPAAPPDAESDLYNRGTQALDASQWANALATFDQVVPMHGAHADGALYWKAYALNKLGRREDSLAALATLEKSYAQSHWVNDAKALEVEIRQSMGQAVSPDSVPDEDLKLIAINGLMNSDPERAVPLLEKVLQGNQSPKVKQRALFVLAQSSSPQARAVIVSIARGQGDRTLQRRAVEDLGLFGGKESKAELAQIYASTDDIGIKKEILHGFMASGDKDRLLTAAKSEKSPELRREAVRQLGVMGAGSELGQLYQSESNVDIKREIIRAMFVGGQADRLTALAQTEKDDQLRGEAIRSLGLMGPRSAETLNMLYQSEKSAAIRKEILNAYFLQNNVPALIKVARTEPDPELRKAAVEKLSIMKSKEASDYMLEILNK